METYRDIQVRTQTGAAVTKFLSPYEKELKSKTDAEKHGELIEMKVHT